MLLLVGAVLSACTVAPVRTQPPAEVRDLSTTREIDTSAGDAAGVPTTADEVDAANSAATTPTPVSSGATYDLPRTKSDAELPIVYFTSGGARLDARARTAIKGIADRLNSASLFARNVLITGFSDSTGTPEANLTLSRERAETVARELVLNGIARERMSLRGVGERRGAAPDAAGGEADVEDRRVEISVLPTNGVTQ